MSQNIFKDPIVASAPVLTGTGNGTLSIDRLTHFTVTQTYTLTCIAKSPDTLFAVVGSLDGTVGIATVGTQFFDQDLKVFLTIQQGSTVFEVGDQFVVGVENGTDLNQQNIDTYDEVPQKNFGAGVLGTQAGDHNLRFSNTARNANLIIQDLEFTAVTAGAAGDGVTIEYTTGGTAGSEVVGVTGNDITIQIESGVSTAAQVKAALDGDISAAALIATTIIGNSSAPQYGSVSVTNLSGGKNKRFAFNHDELSDAGSFVEGNADVLAKNVDVAANLSVAGSAKFAGQVVLDSTSSPAVSSAQDFLNALIQDGKIVLKTSDDSKLQWTAPDLSFVADIEIHFTDTDEVNSIALADSPISIADGESLYAILDRDNTVTVASHVAAQVPRLLNAFRIASRIGDTLILWDNTLVRNGKSVRIGEGGEGGTVKIEFHDPVSTVLPSGVSAVVDGVSVVDGDLVLFTNLLVNNNRVYKVSGVGVALVWTVQSVFSTGVDATDGDDVLIINGDGFASTRGVFNGTFFDFNFKVRYFNGADYWEVSSLNTASLTASTTDDVFTVAFLNSENMIVDFSIIRGSVKETGTLNVTTDGTTAVLTHDSAYLGSTGITFSADISGSDLRVRYTSDGSGGTATMKYFVRRWSDSAGGPGGVPSYTTTPPTPSGAAGSNTEIQFNDSGILGSDAGFTWDGSTLSLLGLEILGLQGPVSILDNQVTNAVAFTIPVSYTSSVVEYSITRDTMTRTGRIVIANDGILVDYSDDYVETGAGLGISSFTADISGANIRILYTSTNTGNNGTMKYSIRRWS